MAELAPVVTIDGPSASGKGTVSRMLAKALDWRLLDSGSLYRVLALAAQNHMVDIHNEDALELLAEHLDVQFEFAEDEPSARIILEGQNVSDEIRKEECGQKASIVACLPKVRKALLARQRAFRIPPGLVADGRDMGTVVFPDASWKVFLTASAEERAYRRYKQLKEKGLNVILDGLIKEVAERDKRDAEREVAPLKPAEGAVIIDTTHLNTEEVLNKVLSVVGVCTS